MDEPKTKLLAQALGNLVGESSALILMTEKDQAYDVVMRSADNLTEAKVLLAGYLNIRDLLGYDKLILPLKALDVLSVNLE